MKFRCSRCNTVVEEKEVLLSFDTWIFVNGKRHQGYRKVYYIPECPKCGGNIFDSDLANKEPMNKSFKKFYKSIKQKKTIGEME
jgi:NAD-dependent SIR2 family protein deacetylase